MSRYLTYLLIHRRKEKRVAGIKNARKNFQSVSLAILAVLLVALTVIPLVAGVYYARLTTNLPSVDWLPLYLSPENGTLLNPTTIYDRNGQTVLYRMENSGISRRFLSIDPNSQEFISPYLVQFTVAEYEPDFWTSAGYNTDWLDDSKPLTIAERVVERLLLWNEPPGRNHNLRRRLLAAQITGKFGRTQILEWFFNSTAYGYLSIGADAAARLYFNKPASLLTIGQAAVLTGVSRTPSLNPFDAPLAALENQQELLNRLHADKLLSDQDFRNANQEEIIFQKAPEESNSTARAFTRLVINELASMYGQEQVELGGYKVVSSLNMEMQLEVSCTTNIQVQRLDGTDTATNDCQPARLLPNIKNTSSTHTDLMASSLVMDPNSGEVLAYLGDSDGQKESPFNAIHQAGSTLTPLIAVNAFARGFSPASQVWDIPADLSLDLQPYEAALENYHGPLRLRTALANNYLAPVSKLFEQLGANLIWRSASSFGLTNIPDTPSPQDLLYEGQSGSVLEIAQLYSSFATLGTRFGQKDSETGSIKPVIIKSIETFDHKPLFEQTTPDEQAIVSPQLAYLVHDVLQDEYERRNSLGYPNLLETGRPTAAKYGGTFIQDEVWTAGYTPDYTVIVWVGSTSPSAEDPGETLDFKYAGGIWYALMQWLHSDLPPQNWQQPAGISEEEVCALSGLLPTRQCPNTVREIFIDGTEPVSYDNLFKDYEINRETGLLATVFTAPDLIEKRTYLVVPEEALDWALAANIEIPPRNYDAIQASPVNQFVNISAPAIYSFVNGDVEIKGTAAGSDLESFRIQVGPGLNPGSWLQIGDEQTLAKTNRVLAVWDTLEQPDGLFALRLQVIRTGQRVETYTIQLSVDNTPPQVRLLYPEAEAIIPISTLGTITLQAEASDGAGMQRIEWWLDGQLAGSSQEMPYSYPLNINTGKHTLYLVAYDLAGNYSKTEEIEFTVSINTN
jgi:membrane peptidoglycan carboxypeptidase